MLVDAPAIGGDKSVEARPESVDEFGHFLGVFRLRQSCEADNVGEENGGLLALLFSRSWGVLGVQLGAHGGQSGIDDGISQQRALRLERRHRCAELGSVGVGLHAPIVAERGPG